MFAGTGSALRIETAPSFLLGAHVTLPVLGYASSVHFPDETLGADSEQGPTRAQVWFVH